MQFDGRRTLVHCEMSSPQSGFSNRCWLLAIVNHGASVFMAMQVRARPARLRRQAMGGVDATV
jgi:hypothetical protein